jgi:acyl-CoA synthetase (NDP forming)
VVGYSWRGIEERFYQVLMENGVPLFADPQRAARALAALVRYHREKDGPQAVKLS